MRLGRVLTGGGLACLACALLVNPASLALLAGHALQPFNRNLALAMTCILALFGGLLMVCRRQPARQLGLTVGACSLVLSLVALDVTLSSLRRERLNVFRANPRGTGSYRLRPDLRLRSRHGTVIETNTHGMRWREVPRNTPPGAVRVAFLGDSFTFGESADRVENALVGVFDRLGRAQGVEALNFGVGGYGLDDSALLLGEEALAFHPQCVILNLYVGNDLRDTWLGRDKFAFDRDYNTTGWRQPNFDERVPAEFRAGWNAGKWLHEHSSLYQLLKDGRPRQASSGQLAPFQPGATFMQYTFWSRQPLPPVAEAAVGRAEEVLAEIRDTCQRAGVPLLLVLIPYRDQVYAAQEQGPGFDVRQPQQRLVAWAKERSLPVLDLYPGLRARVLGQQGLELYASEHLNNAGHELAGQWIWEFYAREASPPTRPR